MSKKVLIFYCKQKIHHYHAVMIYYDKHKMDLSTQKILAYSLDENLTPSKLRKSENLSDFFSDEKNYQSAVQLQSRLDSHNVIWLLDDDSKFPIQLHSIQNTPAIFYAIGNLDLLHRPILWIVWPREMSQYANQVMQALFMQLSGSDIATVSWMARGVDQLCHQLSIAYHLPTIAILWWWIRHYRNSSARSFIQQILQNWWLILSEFKLDFQPTSWSFPQRNRLISWLSKAIFLPEAREWSGSLITANFAYQQHKPIFVAPNPLFSNNGVWSNQLVSSWKATLLSDFNQILNLFDISHSEIDVDSSPAIDLDSLDSEEQTLLNIVYRHHDQDFSEWIGKISPDLWDAMCKLTDLELKWYISQSTPWLYSVKVKMK